MANDASERWVSTEPFEHERIGAVAIYCSDGRYNQQFDEFLHRRLGLRRYDRLTVRGGPAALAGTTPRTVELDVAIGAQGYPGEVNLGPADLTVGGDKWKAR